MLQRGANRVLNRIGRMLQARRIERDERPWPIHLVFPQDSSPQEIPMTVSRILIALSAVGTW